MRWTRAVHAIWHVLSGADQALDHAQIMESAQRMEGAAVDRVTVYRSLSRLVEAGLVRRVAGDDRRWRFVIAQAAAESPSRKAKAGGAPMESFQDCPTCHRVTPMDEVLAQAPASARRWLTQLLQTAAGRNVGGGGRAGAAQNASGVQAHATASDAKLRLMLIAACGDCSGSTLAA